MITNNRHQILSGIGTGFLVWILLVIADLLDELMLDEGFLVGAFIYILVPIILLICYIFNYIVYKPKSRKVLIWFSSYGLTFIILWLFIFILVNNDLFVIQKYRGYSIYLNGMEYMFYGISAVLAFGVLLLIFHLLIAIIDRRKNDTI